MVKPPNLFQAGGIKKTNPSEMKVTRNMKRVAVERLGYSQKQAEEWASGKGKYEVYEYNENSPQEFCPSELKMIPKPKRVGIGRFKKNIEFYGFVACVLRAFFRGCWYMNVYVDGIPTTFVVRYLPNN